MTDDPETTRLRKSGRRFGGCRDRNSSRLPEHLEPLVPRPLSHLRLSCCEPRSPQTLDDGDDHEPNGFGNMKIRAKKQPPHCPEIRSWCLRLATPQRNVDPASHMPLWPKAKCRSRNFRFSIPFILNNSRHRHAKAPPKPLTPPVTLRSETGKDIDHRTNTIVSRPGQFRVALRMLWSSTADRFFSRVGDGPVGRTCQWHKL